MLPFLFIVSSFTFLLLLLLFFLSLASFLLHLPLFLPIYFLHSFLTSSFFSLSSFISCFLFSRAQLRVQGLHASLNCTCLIQITSLYDWIKILIMHTTEIYLSFQSQFNAIHTLKQQFPKIHLSIILPSMRALFPETHRPHTLI
jgi:hypothetical protein